MEVTSNNDLQISYGKDVRFGTKWAIEHYDGGLNFANPCEMTSPCATNILFISDNGGNIGIGNGAPYAKLQIHNKPTNNWTPYIYGYYINSQNVSQKSFRIVTQYDHSDLYLHDVNGGTGSIVLRSSGTSVFNDVDMSSLDVTGPITMNGHLVVASDKTLKSNIKEIDKRYEKINQIEAYTYTLKNDSIRANEILKKKNNVDFIDTTNTGKNIEVKEQIGFIAQEVQEIFPELVYEVKDNTLGINYIGFIPLLVEAYKDEATKTSELETTLQEQIAINTSLQTSLSELLEKVDELEKTVEKCCDIENESTLKSGSVDESTKSERDLESLPDSALESIILEQNTPNPFNETTTIAMYLPENISVATLYIYDLNGTQKTEAVISERGNTTVNIAANTLTPGLFLYTLICDGKLIATKQMIVTD